MKIATDFTVKLLQDCNKGELVSRPGRGVGNLAIVIGQSDNGAIQFLALHDSSPHPCPYIEISATSVDEEDQSCMTYGRDWMLEVVPTDQSYVKAHDVGETLGSVHLINDQACMGVRRYSDRGGENEIIDLTTFESVHPRDKAAIVFDRWRIWANEASGQRPNAMPLYERTPPLLKA